MKTVVDYRLYIDEAGDHAACIDGTAPVGQRYLGLIGIVLPCGILYEKLSLELDAFKRKHLPYDPDERPPVLHRRDIVERRGAFRVLQDDAKKSAFNDDLLSIINSTRFMAIAVVVDKLTHGRATYRRLSHPYHYCLLGMLERYCGWLKLMNLRGDVLVESRGGSEDLEFKKAYEDLYDSGSGAAGHLSRSTVQLTLTSRTPKLKKKEQNLAGLQLADLLAHPLVRDVLVTYGRLPHRGSAFADRIAEVVRTKYNRQIYTGKIEGYGQVILL
jgi:hypothetical protein